MPHHTTYAQVLRTIERDGVRAKASRIVPEEVPVAFSYGGTTHAVMMATPADLEEFAIGFSLSEQIIAQKEDIVMIDIVDVDGGIDVQIHLVDGVQSEFAAKRRMMVGPVGCGLCGVETIKDIMRELPRYDENNFCLPHSSIIYAIEQLELNQKMRTKAGAVHAAAFINFAGNLELLREDVGRHNALDKLIGALVTTEKTISHGAILITSRVSVDLIQKTALSGVPILIAVSTPTALAIRMAEEAGLTLIALARKDGFEIYTRPERVCLEKKSNVA